MTNQHKIFEEVKKVSQVSGEYKIVFLLPGSASVELISYTGNPDRVMHLTTRGYKGIYDSRSNASPDYTAEDAIADIAKTKLRTPLEMVHMLWLLKDVSRAFTHQIVRYRVGTSFVQESMRFFGMQKRFNILITGQNKNELDYIRGCVSAVETYVDLIDSGVADQDARGVLPTNIMTHMFFDCSLQTLSHIMPQRLCCQAQPGEWQRLMVEMRAQVKLHMGNSIENLLKAPYELGQDCGYRASFDRPCVWVQETTIDTTSILST